MTDGGSESQPGRGEPAVPIRPRGAFVAHEVFGHGDGAVLVEPEVARGLRTAAEAASRQARVTGGLLYGRRWADADGRYLVVDGFLEASRTEASRTEAGRTEADGDGGGADGGNRGSGGADAPPDGREPFTLPEAELRLLRAEAAQFAGAREAGWWRSLPGPGEFSPRDLQAQRELVGPGGAGLLVFGSGLDWGTAYLGPDGRVPGSARSFIPVPRPATEAPSLPSPGHELVPAAGPGDDREPGAAPPAPETTRPETTRPGTTRPGTTVTARRRPVLTPPPQPTVQRAISVRVPSREWGGPRDSGAVRPETPADVKIVVWALVIVAVLAAALVGMLMSNLLVAVTAGLVLLLGLAGFLWMARL